MNSFERNFLQRSHKWFYIFGFGCNPHLHIAVFMRANLRFFNENRIFLSVKYFLIPLFFWSKKRPMTMQASKYSKFNSKIFLLRDTIAFTLHCLVWRDEFIEKHIQKAEIESSASTLATRLIISASWPRYGSLPSCSVLNMAVDETLESQFPKSSAPLPGCSCALPTRSKPR